MKTVEEIALEEWKKLNTGAVTDNELKTIVELVVRSVVAVDAERGKAQLPVGFVDHGGIVYWHNKENKPPANDTRLFLSPTIPEGMALVPITGEREGFIVLAVWNYEGSSPVRVFESEADAESFRAKCSNYHSIKNPSPGLDESEESQDLFDAWIAEDSAWRESHPAGDSCSSADSFQVCSITIQAAGVTK